MTKNDILRKIRYAFDFSDTQMIDLFGSGGLEVTREQVSNWMKREEDPDFEVLSNKRLAIFLNGLINEMRGKREGPQPEPESVLTNNIVLRKLKIALNFNDVDMIEIWCLMKVKISKHELSAFFRNPNQAQYRDCNNQFLRNFLHGLQLKLRHSEEG
jgi:uncharacterized protein YehS (DUF1456 family)